MLVNQFPEVSIAGTEEKITTTAPDQFLLTGMLDENAVVTVQIEGGKRNGSGVEIQITGDEGDLKIANTSAFDDAMRMHRLFDLFEQSARDGKRVEVV